MTLVVDASLVASALTDGGEVGRWASSLLVTEPAAPHLLSVEVASMLRRAERTGKLSTDLAAVAHGDLLGLDITWFAYEPLAERVWELRHSVTTYDGWYVALAEALDAPLATLDHRLTRAPGTRCAFVGPDAP